MNEIFLDIETTGLSYKEKHKIVEIACIETSELIPTKVFHKLINPEGMCLLKRLNTGHSTSLLKSKPRFVDIANEFVNFIKDKNLIIHNASFDVPFLNFELNLIGKNSILQNKVIDTLEIARGKFPGTSNSLDALCKRFGVDLSRRKKHNALLDWNYYESLHKFIRCQRT